jgi:hypothetical protein
MKAYIHARLGQKDRVVLEELKETNITVARIPHHRVRRGRPSASMLCHQR